MNSPENKRGHYLGMEIDGKWWRRYSEGGFFARGLGEYWIDASALSFRRDLTEVPIVIAFRDVVEVTLGTWHSGRWAAGAPVVKIVWETGSRRLSSGFVVSRDERGARAVADEIRSRIG